MKKNSELQKYRMFQIYETFTNLNVVPFISSDIDAEWYARINDTIDRIISQEFEDPYKLSGMKNYTKMFFQYHPTKLTKTTVKAFEPLMRRAVTEYTMYKLQK